MRILENRQHELIISFKGEFLFKDLLKKNREIKRSEEKTSNFYCIIIFWGPEFRIFFKQRIMNKDNQLFLLQKL